jgi:hypothetical protein
MASPAASSEDSLNISGFPTPSGEPSKTFTPTKGTPRSQSAPSPGKKSTPKTARTPKYTPPIGPAIGLLVEDDLVSSKIEQRALEQALSGKIDIAGSFADALEKLNSYPYRFLVTDHNLGEQDKENTTKRAIYTVARKVLFPDGLGEEYAEGSVLLKAAQHLPSTQKPQASLLISSPVGITEEELAKFAKAHGAGFVRKPISMEQLQAFFAPFLASTGAHPAVQTSSATSTGSLPSTHTEPERKTSSESEKTGELKSISEEGSGSQAEGDVLATSSKCSLSDASKTSPAVASTPVVTSLHTGPGAGELPRSIAQPTEGVPRTGER